MRRGNVTKCGAEKISCGDLRQIGVIAFGEKVHGRESKFRGVNGGLLGSPHFRAAGLSPDKILQRGGVQIIFRDTNEDRLIHFRHGVGVQPKAGGVLNQFAFIVIGAIVFISVANSGDSAVTVEYHVVKPHNRRALIHVASVHQIGRIEVVSHSDKLSLHIGADAIAGLQFAGIIIVADDAAGYDLVRGDNRVAFNNLVADLDLGAVAGDNFHRIGGNDGCGCNVGSRVFLAVKTEFGGDISRYLRHPTLLFVRFHF